MKLLYVFVGGGLGSILRFLLSKWSNKFLLFSALGTLSANVIGCFLIGFFANLFVKQSNINQTLTYLLITGFCGGFTTFSSFSYENISLIKNGQMLSFLFYTFVSLTLGLVGVFLGIEVSKLISR